MDQKESVGLERATALTAETDDVDSSFDALKTELKLMWRELTYIRWCCLCLFALLTILAAHGLLTSFKQ